MYPYLATLNPNTQNVFFFLVLLENIYVPHFHQKIKFFHYAALKEEDKYAHKKNVFLPTYPTKKYRVGVQQTNIFLRIALYQRLLMYWFIYLFRF